jgi:predicted transposase YbfD/YdcC
VYKRQNQNKSIKTKNTNTNTNPTKVKQTFISVVTAFATSTRIALAQKSFRNSEDSEIPAFREVVNILGLKGKVYTGDAIHAQKETTKTIIESGNDYVLQVKGNQGKLKNQLKKTAPSTHRSKKTSTTKSITKTNQYVNTPSPKKTKAD